MASTSTPRTLLGSGTPTQNLKCEVFLSFRGPDTRRGFTSHLYEALKSKFIDVFRDEEKLEKGFEIHPYLKAAIEISQYAIVIISERFADSKSCLIELSEIMERKQEGYIIVYPVFYHVEPSDVRHQKGMFGEHFAQFRKKVGSKVDTAEWEKWTGTLKEVGELKGWHVQNSDEAEIVQEISLKILYGLVAKPKDISASFFGIETQVQDIIKMLSLESGGVRLIGICGIGGIGKSTLAKVVRAKVSPKFNASCFIDVGKDDVLELGKQLVHELISPEFAELLKTLDSVTRTLESRLKNGKVLIVLDDLHEGEKLKALAKAEWFGDGSRIIITSRDRKWPCLDKDNIYDVKTLTGRPAFELFCSKAFPQGDPKEEFWALVEELVNLAKGLPLALEIYGSSVKGEEKGYWEGYRDQLKKNVDEGVKRCLQTTFDRLNSQLREAFLDIVCFFVGSWGCLDRDRLKEKLVWLGHSSNILTDLENKSLLKFVKDEVMVVKSLSMHDLLVQMGEKIVDKERLWRDQDIVSELQENSEKTEIDKLTVLWLQHSSIYGNKPIKICLGAFSKMKNLRIIYIFDYLQRLEWCGEYQELKLSNELRYLSWYGYPYESLPTGFIPTNLIALSLNNCSIKQLWIGNECFLKLKDIDLYFSRALEETPEFNSVPNLESLNLSYCTNLSVIHPSIGHLKHLKELNLSNCSSLEQLPDIITSTSLKVLNLQQCLELKGLPNEIQSKSLKYLNLSSCPKLENLPAILGKIPSLQYIDISEDATKEFPFSFQRLPFLEEFHAKGTHIGAFRVDIVFSKEKRVLTVEFYDSNTSVGLIPNLSSLKCQILHDVIMLDEVESSGHSGLFECSHDGHKELLEALFSSLKSLWKVSLINCNLEAIPKSIGYWFVSRLDLSKNKIRELPNSMCKLSNLEKLYLNDCTSLGALPDSMCKLSNLEKLHLNNCISLAALPNSMGKLSSLKELYLNDCTSLGTLPNSMCELSNLEKLHLNNCTFLAALPNGLCKLSSLKELYLNDCISLEALPKSVCKLFSLKELYLNCCTSLGALPKLPLSLYSLKLQNCPSLDFESLMHALIPNSINCCSSVAYLNLSNNRVRGLPDGLCELSNLKWLALNDCTSLQTLPKFPLSLESLQLTNCPSLPTSILSSLVTYIGFDCKPHMILNLHIQDPMYTMPMDDEKFHNIEPGVVCGPTQKPRIPEWFIHRCASSNKTIRIHMDWNSANDSPDSANPVAYGSPDACALLIVYEVNVTEKCKSRRRKFDELENSDISASEGSNHIFPEFVCQLQCKEVSSQQTFIIRVPEVARVGSHGVWVLINIPHSMHESNFMKRSYLASITASSENVKLKEFAGRLLNEGEYNFIEVVKDAECNFFEDVAKISRPGLDSESIGDALRNYLEVTGPNEITIAFGFD